MDGAQLDNGIHDYIRLFDGQSFETMLPCILALARTRPAGDSLKVLALMNQRESKKAVADSLERLRKAGRAVETPDSDGKKTWHALLPQAKLKPVQSTLFSKESEHG